MRSRVAACALLVACASAGEGPRPAVDGPPTSADAPGIEVIRTCPAGRLAIGVDAAGGVTCALPDEPARAAIGAGCAAYLGWRDGCDGCTTPPLKWGRAGATCTNVGVDTTCTTAMLGGTDVPMFGLNLDGDMDGNDKLYGSLHCSPPPATTSPAPCPAGAFVTGRAGSSWTCAPLAGAAIAYVRDSCALYLGWQDGCDGCTTSPVKWGRAGGASCQNGTGADNTCSTAALGAETVNLFGLNPDGDVDGNDKVHVGLHCGTPMPASGPAMTTCPAGQFVTGTSPDGTFRCASPAAVFHRYVTGQCSLYFGWRDNCDGCVLPPSKWGSTRVGSCTLGVGADDTCGRFPLGELVDLYGLNPDGNVDGNDTFYVGLRCN